MTTKVYVNAPSPYTRKQCERARLAGKFDCGDDGTSIWEASAPRSITVTYSPKTSKYAVAHYFEATDRIQTWEV